MSAKSILIVEDEDSIRELLSLTLELDGYKIFSAENGRAGLDLLERINPPDLILLDLMMPTLDGWQFVEELHKRSELASIPVIIVTAFGEKTRTIQSSAVLKKPIDLDALFKTVQKYVGPASMA